VENIYKQQRELTLSLQNELENWRKLITEFNTIDKDELLYDLCISEPEAEDYLSEIENLVNKTQKISINLDTSVELQDSLILSNLSLKQINNHLRRILRKREILREKGAMNIQETFNSIIQK